MHRSTPATPTLVVGALIMGLMLCALAGTAGAADNAAEASTPIDLNRADVKQLMEIPGIGEVTAQRIVEFREKHGPFGRVEDLLKVKGIGEKSFEKLRPYVKVSKK